MRRAEVVDADEDAGIRDLSDRLRDEVAGVGLRVLGDGVLEVEHERVGAVCDGLGHELRPASGHEEQRAKRLRLH